MRHSLGKRMGSLVLLTCLILGLLCVTAPMAMAWPTTAIPAGGTITAPGLYDISTTAETTITISVGGVSLTGTKSNLVVVISAGITLTLKDAHITGPSGNVAIFARGADCGLILVGVNSATATGGGGAGVAVPSTSSLTIEGPGQLTAIGGGGSAGVGGSTGASNGSITIRHAIIIADGTESGAGIGGGSGNAGTAGGGSNISIINSSVVARGGNSATNTGGGAGIGGGGGGVSSAGGAGNSITITNSVVQAVGGAGHTHAGNMGTGGGAGIGGGGSNNTWLGGDGMNISIDAASSVQANGGNGANGASVGGGGGGGAAVGGGGGGAYSLGGVASVISVAGNVLYMGSAPGIGGTGITGASTGALCGNGGAGQSNTPGIELGNVSVIGVIIDLTSHPQASHVGYPSLPSVSNPTNQVVNPGATATFSVAASSGTPLYYYQWQLSTDNGGTWNDIDAGTNASVATASLSVTNVVAADHGKAYRCVVNDFVFRETVSSLATLSVNTAPTINASSAATDNTTLTLGYATAYPKQYTIAGNPVPTLSITSDLDNSGATITNAGLLEIPTGLGIGTYTIEATATNSVAPDATLTFTLTVVGNAPAINGSATLTDGDALTLGYAQAYQKQYTITGNPAPTLSVTNDPQNSGATITNAGLLEIPTGLGIGTYTIGIIATNGVIPDATLTFTLTVSAVPLVPTITGVAASPTSHAATGGASTVTITGNGLTASTITVQVFNAANQPVAGLVATRTAAGNVTLTFPWNSSSTQDEVYTIRTSLDGGVTWATPTAQVTVLLESPQHGNATDPATGVAVSGPMYGSTGLTVSTTNVLHAAGCSTCDRIRKLDGAGHVLKFYEVELNPHIGGNHTYTVTLPVGAARDGKTLSIIHCNAGVMELSEDTTSGGVVKTTVTSFSPFVVLDGRYAEIMNSGGTPKTGDDYPIEWMLLGIAAMLGGAVILLVRGRRHQSA